MMDGRIMNAIRAVTCGGFLLIAGTQFPANAASMLVPGDYGVWLKEGYECGMAFENYDNIQTGDMIECFEMEQVAVG